MIRFDGIELMNSLLHISEDVLGELALACCPRERSGNQVLIGGLGLGFTLAAALRSSADLPPEYRPQLRVAELMPCIIAWYETWFRPGLNLPPQLAPELIAGDVYQVLATLPPQNVICLDIDNGPSYLATGSNSKLYEPAGLRHLQNHLQADGVCLIWSANEEPALIEQAQACGFSVGLRRTHSPMSARVFEQYVYVLSLPPLTDAFCQLYQVEKYDRNMHHN